MSKKLFNEEDREHLSKNRYVTRISDKAITYSDEFKLLFIDQYMMGRTPREIFEANGFDVHVIGMKRVEQCADRWKKAYGRAGIIGLADSRKESSGRPLKRELKLGIIYNLKRIRRLMKNMNLICLHRKPNPYKRMAKATLEHRLCTDGEGNGNSRNDCSRSD